jgi:hypothetical protein
VTLRRKEGKGRKEGNGVPQKKSQKSTTTVAYIRWFDSAIYKGEACQPDDLDLPAAENESAGVVVKEDEEAITIALDRCLDTKDVRLVLCVPKTNVRSIRHFSV